jgi:hypothetical protein
LWLILAVGVGSFFGSFAQPWGRHLGEHIRLSLVFRKYPAGTGWCRECGKVFIGRDYAKPSKDLDPGSKG